MHKLVNGYFAITFCALNIGPFVYKMLNETLLDQQVKRDRVAEGPRDFKGSQACRTVPER